MKSRTLKSFMFLFTVACLFSLLFLSASAADKTVGDFVFSVNGSTATLKEYKGNDTDVVIPSKVDSAKVTTIGNEAFWGNSSMKTVSIPSTVTVIGTAAFNECTSLKKVVLPSKLTTLGEAVFWYCTNLRQVFIPKTTTVIGDNAFTGCHESLTVYVVKGSFAESRMSAFREINMAYRYVTELKFTTASLKLEAGASKTLVYTYSPVNVYNSKVTYSSSNTAVATVDASGKVTAKGVGTATITCTAKDGSKVSAKCTVTVVPAKVTSFKATDVTLTGYTLSWAKSEGAAKYRVYRYNSSTKKYDTIKYTTATSLKVTDMKAGSYQYYKVLAYTTTGGKTYKAAISSAFKVYTAKPAKVAAITAKPARNYINLSWSAPKDATGYRVYLYNRETSKYTFLGSTAKTSYKVTDLLTNTKYTFMVRAYATVGSSTAYAAYSPLTDCTTRPEYVSGLSVKAGSVYTARLTLRWDKLDGVAGYQLCTYDEEKASWVSLAIISGADSTEYTVTELKAGTAYKFRVRAYADLDGEKHYGYYPTEYLTASTNDRPSDVNEAYTSFTEAFLTDKTSDGSFTLISIYETDSLTAENEEICRSVADALGIEKTVYSYIVDGAERKSGLSAGKLICDSESTVPPDASFVTDAAYEDDGNGTRLSFTLSPDALSEFIKLPDWNKVNEEYETFTLVSCTYGNAEVSSKFQNGHTDDITVTVPMTAVFTLDGEEYSFTQSYSLTHLFIR